MNDKFKITKIAQVKIPKGYRRLMVGEIEMTSDKWWSWNNQCFCNFNIVSTGYVQRGHVVIRKIRKPKQ